ncbi:MAG TPA: hypothetical protein VGR35_19530 [Tepidisphaeraceae bacterium]|nr:hypothetical protein [Tepidisphaeraceae bacterium]
MDEGQSRLAVAARYQVSNALIGKLLRQRRQSGSIAPKPPAGGNRPAFGRGGALVAVSDCMTKQVAAGASVASWRRSVNGRYGSSSRRDRGGG